MKFRKKELDKKLANSIKIDTKNYGLKSRGITLFKKVNDYFIYITIGISGINGEKIAISGYVKPYVVDDVFWKVFNMSKNSEEPMGLRANGAFKIDGATAFLENIEYGDVHNIGDVAKELLKKCYEKLMSIVNEFKNYNDFLEFSKESKSKTLYDYALVNMLLLINEGKYSEARQDAEKNILDNKYGRFRNEGKFIYEHIIDYCNLSENRS